MGFSVTGLRQKHNCTDISQKHYIIYKKKTTKYSTVYMQLPGGLLIEKGKGDKKLTEIVKVLFNECTGSFSIE